MGEWQYVSCFSKNLFCVSAFSVETQGFIFLNSFLFCVLNILVEKEIIWGGWILVLILFSHLWSHSISGTSADMSWLQGGWFMAVSGYKHVWESKQYYRTCWSTDYLQQGHIDPNFFLSLPLLLFLWAFFRSGLDYKIAGSSFPLHLVCGFPLKTCSEGHN